MPPLLTIAPSRMRNPTSGSTAAILMLVAGTTILASAPAVAQAPDSTPRPRPAASAPTRAEGPSLSGVLYLHFQSGGSRADRQLGQQNRFEVDRAYLTVRAPAGDHMSIRVTADVFQQRDQARGEYYGGWSYRLKYAYAQYGYLRGGSAGLSGEAQLGMIPTVIIGHEEGFWNRGIAQTALDREGYFSSADVGASTRLTLPARGELLVGVFNGTGYQAREADRFKDVGARLVFTPLAGGASPLRTLAVTPWYYKGWRARTISDDRSGVRRDRYGMHVGVRNPRVTVGAQLARRSDAAEVVAGLPPEIETREVTGSLLSAYTFIRPLGFLGERDPGALSLVARVDEVRPDVEQPGRHRFLIGGIGWDLNRRSQLWLDYQGQEARDGSTRPDLKTLYARAIIAF